MRTVLVLALLLPLGEAAKLKAVDKASDEAAVFAEDAQFWQNFLIETEGSFDNVKVQCIRKTYRYSEAERARLEDCHCGAVVAAYDANVYFAGRLLDAIGAAEEEKEQALKDGFFFFMQKEIGDCAIEDAADPLYNYMKCHGQHPAAVGDIGHALLQNPLVPPVNELGELCKKCYAEFDRERCNLRNNTGGAGGGTGYQIYCVNEKTNQIEFEIFEGGGR